MTQVTCNLIANEFKQLQPFIQKVGPSSDYQKGKYAAWHTLAMNFATTLQECYPQLDIELFLDACGVITLPTDIKLKP